MTCPNNHLCQHLPTTAILVRHQYNISAGASGMHDMGDDETDRTDAGNRCRDSSFAHETGGGVSVIV